MDFDLKTASVVIGMLSAPILAKLLIPRPQWMPWALFGLVFMSLIGGDRNFFSVDELTGLSPHAGYRGYDRGLQVTISDILLLAMAVALIFQRCQALRFRDTQLAAFAAYAVITLISLTVALEPRFAIWEIARTLKWVVLFWVVLNTVRDERSLRFAIGAIVLFLITQTVVVMWQRYGLGVHRTRGTLAHPNSLGMTINLFFPLVVVALIRARTALLPPIALLAVGCLGAVICSLSRGGLGAIVISMIAVFAMESARGRWSTLFLRGGVLAALLLPIGLISMDSIASRVGEIGFDPGLTRRLQNELAMQVIESNPLGVGANNFALAASEAVRIRTVESGTLNKNPGLVHNALLLETAETGWMGLAILLWLGFLPIVRGWRLLRRGGRLDWMGCAVVAGMCVFWAQAQVEWIYKQTEVFAGFVIYCAMCASALRFARTDDGIDSRRALT